MPAVHIERSSDEAVVMMLWHDIYVLWLKGAATVENQREAEHALQKAFDQLSRGFGVLVVIDAAHPPLSAEVRRELDAIYIRLAPKLRAVSYVIVGGGFQATMVRSALISMNWVVRRAYPTSTTGDLKKGIAWLYYTLGEDPERGTIDQFIAALGAAVRGEAPKTLRTQKKQ